MIPLADKETRLFLDATWNFGEIPQWFQVIPGPGKWKHPEWGDVTVTAADLKEFAKNFKDGIYQEHIPIDAEHQTKLSGACGYFTDVKVGGPKGEPGLWAQAEWTDRGKTLLTKERYRYFSPEWYQTWKQPDTNKEFSNVLVGGALTTRPFFKDQSLKPLVATEGYLWSVSEKEGTEQWQEIERQASQPDPETKPEKRGGNMSDIKLTLTEDQAKAVLDGKDIEFSADQLGTVREHVAATIKATEMNPEVARRFAELETQNKDLAAIAQRGVERVAAMERESKRREFAEFARANRMAFKGEVDEIVGQLEKFSGELSPESFTAYLDERKEFSARLKESGLFSQIGHENAKPATVADEMEALVTAKMGEGMTRPDATIKVASENAALYNRYNKEQMAARGGA